MSLKQSDAAFMRYSAPYVLIDCLPFYHAYIEYPHCETCKLSSAMKRPAENGQEPPVKKLQTSPPIGQVAQEDQHVFISLQAYCEKGDKLFEGGHSVVFIRGGVATRKTTLAEHLARQFPEKYVTVPFTGEGNQLVWVMGIVEAIEKRTTGSTEMNWPFGMP